MGDRPRLGAERLEAGGQCRVARQVGVRTWRTFCGSDESACGGSPGHGRRQHVGRNVASLFPAEGVEVADALVRRLDLLECRGRLRGEADAVLHMIEPLLLDGDDDLALRDDRDRRSWLKLAPCGGRQVTGFWVLMRGGYQRRPCRPSRRRAAWSSLASARTGSKTRRSVCSSPASTEYVRVHVSASASCVACHQSFAPSRRRIQRRVAPRGAQLPAVVPHQTGEGDRREAEAALHRDLRRGRRRSPRPRSGSRDERAGTTLTESAPSREAASSCRPTTSPPPAPSRPLRGPWSPAGGTRTHHRHGAPARMKLMSPPHGVPPGGAGPIGRGSGEVFVAAVEGL